MKRFRKTILWIICLLIITNTPFGANLFNFLSGQVKRPYFGFATNDLLFCNMGYIDKIVSDGSFDAYKRAYPMADHKVYRISPQKSVFRFWMWREYLTDDNWKVPYRDPKGLTLSRFCLLDYR
jgi:hypothetical protein